VVTGAGGGTPITPNDYLAPGFPGQSRVFADLYYNRYRDYDPITGRYIQADPIGLEGGSNPYVYAEANPLNVVDPEGLNPAAVARALCLSNPVALYVCVGGGLAVAAAAANSQAQIQRMNGPRIRSAPLPLTDCQPEDHDYCQRIRDEEENRCREKFGPVDWQYQGCMARAEENYWRCRTGKWPLPRWTDRDNGDPVLPRPPVRRKRWR